MDEYRQLSTGVLEVVLQRQGTVNWHDLMLSTSNGGVALNTPPVTTIDPDSGVITTVVGNNVTKTRIVRPQPNDCGWMDGTQTHSLDLGVIGDLVDDSLDLGSPTNVVEQPWMVMPEDITLPWVSV